MCSTAMGEIMSLQLTESWQISKPAIVTDKGLVASHHHEASTIGAEVLAAGGNAVDAAVATGLAIGVLEPWMSGVGGCGYMMVYEVETGQCHAVDFSTIAPQSLDLADYPIEPSTETDDDLFGWPRVVDDRNVQGPLSIAVPTVVAGLSAALERFGTVPWADAIEPAVAMARRGMKVDWYATLRIALEARGLANYPASREFFMTDGLPAVSLDAGNLKTLQSDRQVATLERLRDAGPEDFYRGDLAQAVARDMTAVGARVTADDLAAYEARIVPARTAGYRDATVHVAPDLNAGPTLIDALQRLEGAWEASGATPDTKAFQAYGTALFEAYAHRLTTMGEGNGESCTTHLTVVDAKGNMVALTQTLLSVFGSRVMLPEVGFLMNNGIMWFDPRPGGPNSMKPGRRPLSNMCPAVVTGASGGAFALGASGGRRIFPAVFQLVSFLTDHGMSLNDAFATPRIDVSGTDLVTVDSRLDQATRDALASTWSTVELPPSVISSYACPNAVQNTGAERHGCAFVTSPWAGVSTG
ncbi:MAG: gamma-glutamyltransferase [Rhodospirillaceae bacterium]|nr:gamma-glutamyltransferase [Rhodospirillaceae bacterium]|tara:strand:+ start:2120 stop:3703 length:1584 start_codon:yes stop_codon:yes gene_type:complete